MNTHIIPAGLVLGLLLIAGNAQAANHHTRTSHAQHAGKLAAGTLWIEPKTKMKFVWAPAGCFWMGDNRDDEQPVHEVCLKGFWMGRYEVTQSQYQQMMGINPSKFRGRYRPVEQVSWDNASVFAHDMSYKTGMNIRLPSEAEWEYACRAGGAHAQYCGKGNPRRLAWYNADSKGWTHKVGQLAPNNWGLYDMSGNVWEWTQDCYHKNYQDAPFDGSAWETGDCTRRVFRGGAWYDNAANLLAANRDNDNASNQINNIGFRVVRTIP